LVTLWPEPQTCKAKSDAEKSIQPKAKEKL